MLAGCLLLSAAAYADGDAPAGKATFDSLCSSCHTSTVGKNGFGPSLAQVIGRRSGSLGGYQYSPAMTNAGVTWDSKTLDTFLTSSTAAVPGTVMQVTVDDPVARARVIAYLSTLGTAPTTTSSPPQVAAELGHGPTGAELVRAATDARNWLYATKDYRGQRYVSSTQITAKNVDRLRPVCIYRSDLTGSTETNPLVYDGTMYFTINEVTVAIDATTCRQRWLQTWPLKGPTLSKVNRGVALKDGRLIRGTPDGYLIALNMADGSLLWSKKIADASASQYLSMPPLVFEDLVVYGPAGADWGAKNWVGAFRLDTGESVWRFNLVPDANEAGADTWGSTQALQHGGGSLWTPLALDAERGVLYLPVGNPAPDFYSEARAGDDLYTNSAVALDVRTGSLLWYHQFLAADDHDRDLSQISPLFSTSVHGKNRNFLTASGKDGLLRVVDRDSHEQLYEIAITSRTNWDARPAVEGAHSCPGLLGGMEWNGPAYSPQTRTLYVSTVDWCGTFTKSVAPPPFTPNAHYYGGAVTPDPRDQARGWLQAVDAVSGAVRWKRQWPTPLVAGVTVTAGGVLLTGDLDNNFLAIDARTGKTLYSFNTGGSIGGGVISYEVGGKQYAASTSGVVSGFFGGSGTSAVVVFALP